MIDFLAGPRNRLWDETFPFGKGQRAVKGLRSSTKQPAHGCALLGDPFKFSQSPASKDAFLIIFMHFQSRCLVLEVRF